MDRNPSMDRRPPLLISFVGTDNRTPDKAVEHAEDAAGAWLQEQNPRILQQTTNLAHADGLWCYVITITWTVDRALSSNGVLPGKVVR